MDRQLPEAVWRESQQDGVEENEEGKESKGGDRKTPYLSHNFAMNLKLL